MLIRLIPLLAWVAFELEVNWNRFGNNVMDENRVNLSGATHVDVFDTTSLIAVSVDYGIAIAVVLQSGSIEQCRFRFASTKVLYWLQMCSTAIYQFSSISIRCLFMFWCKQFITKRYSIATFRPVPVHCCYWMCERNTVAGRINGDTFLLNLRRQRFVVFIMSMHLMENNSFSVSFPSIHSWCIILIILMIHCTPHISLRQVWRL